MSRVGNLQSLPKIRDSWSFLYVEHARIDRDDKAIAIQRESGTTAVPCASLTLLMLGPGTTVTHAAIQTLADTGVLVAWTGEQSVRFYAQGLGETRSSRNLQRQASLWADPDAHLEIVRRMYRMRFREQLPESWTLEQLRGREGVRVRDGYARASRTFGVPWTGRSYRRDDWRAADPVNRALSAANSALYGVCQAAIVALGYSPALGFIHTGKMLSFVYDIADLYKTETTVPAAFRMTSEGTTDLESRTRRACRDAFVEQRLLERIARDLTQLFDGVSEDPYAIDEAAPGDYWEGDHTVPGGRAYGAEPPLDEADVYDQTHES